MLPLILFPLAILLWLYNFLNSTSSPSEVVNCAAQDAVLYVVKQGDSCWGIVEEHGGTVEGLIGLNPGLDCRLLEVGKGICVPGG